jgi:hypothetical protein
MKRFLYSTLLILAFATLGYAAAPATSADWKVATYGSGDHAIALDPSVYSGHVTNNNTPTYLEWVDVMCRRGATLNGNATTSPCVFSINHYATVGTGAIIQGHMYPVSVTSGLIRIPLGFRAEVGAYHVDLTGDTLTRYKHSKPDSMR